jgi:hypothetical protein
MVAPGRYHSVTWEPHNSKRLICIGFFSVWPSTCHWFSQSHVRALFLPRLAYSSTLTEQAAVLPETLLFLYQNMLPYFPEGKKNFIATSSRTSNLHKTYLFTNQIFMIKPFFFWGAALCWVLTRLNEHFKVHACIAIVHCSNNEGLYNWPEWAVAIIIKIRGVVNKFPDWIFSRSYGV